MELKEVPSTIRFMDSPKMSATEITSNLSNSWFSFSLMVSHTITLDIDEFFSFLIAPPDNTGWVATASTDFAPSLMAVSAALHKVPAVSIMSSIIMTSLSLRSPTKFATSAWLGLGLRLSISAKPIFSFFA